MNFTLYINGNPYPRDKIYQLEETIKEALSYWNNFGDHQPLELKVTKEQDDQAIKINVKDNIQTEESINPSQ